MTEKSLANLIPPHGGTLRKRLAAGPNAPELKKYAQSLPRLELTPREISDLEMLGDGALSPLEGFMTRADYLSVVDTMRLGSGLPWTIPITLSVSKGEAQKISEGKDAALADSDGKVLAVMRVSEIFAYDKEHEAKEVYRTTHEIHPGVDHLFRWMKELLIGGSVTVLLNPPHADFLQYRLTPEDTRRVFQEKGWKRIVGFQTRNPIHRAHEYLQKAALEVVDGLLIHPIVGATKSDDIPAEVRMKCYESLIGGYFPKDRVVLAVNPAAMRYAGPREAIFHAIIRKNYGCSHFIVGRDHAGVGNYYGTYDAHKIFDEFTPAELGITPLFFDHAFFCKPCEGMATAKTCPHGNEDHVILSGTAVRQMLSEGKVPPQEFTRPEVAKILIDWMKTKTAVTA